MITNTIQTILYKDVYIFRNRVNCSEDAINKIYKDKNKFDIKKLSEEQITTETARNKITILLSPERSNPRSYDIAFDYFVQYKEKY